VVDLIDPLAGIEAAVYVAADVAIPMASASGVATVASVTTTVGRAATIATTAITVDAKCALSANHTASRKA
jgi:hypothetical protein